MSNATVSRLGQVEAAGDSRALFESIFMGEVLTAFETAVILKPLTRQRVISSGKSADFPAIYKASASYHTPGTEILGSAISHNKVTVNIDDVLIADAFVADIDEAMNHYDVRAPYSNELGLALALAYDKNVFRNIIRSARAPALFTGDTGGSAVNDNANLTSATALAASIWAAKQAMEEADVPVDSTPVYAGVKPAQWYLLAQESTLVLNRDVGGDGNYSQGTFSMIGGVDVVKSNAFRVGLDDSGATTAVDGDVIPAAYRVSMALTAGIVFTEAAAATVSLMGLAMEQVPDRRRQGTLMLAKYAVGHGPLLSKCAVELTDNA